MLMVAHALLVIHQAEPDHLLPVVIDGIRMRRLNGGFVYGNGATRWPPRPRG
jgi:hypothetical protein